MRTHAIKYNFSASLCIKLVRQALVLQGFAVKLRTCATEVQ